MLVASAQLNLLLEEDTRPRGASGENRESNVLHNETNINHLTTTTNGKLFSAEKGALAAEHFVTMLVQKGRFKRFPEIMDVTPDIARALLRRNTQNRPTVKAAIDEYADLMETGRWRLTTEAIGVDKTGVLSNGQHRLMSVVESGATVKFTIWFGIEPDEFEVIDQGRKRTAHHLLHIAGVNAGTNRAAIVRILLMTHGWKTESIPNQIVAEKVIELGHKLHRPLYWSMQFQAAKVTNGTSMGVAAFKIAEAGASQEAVDAFFEPMVKGGEGAGAIQTKLRNALAIGELRGPSSPSMTVKRVAAVIHAWNAYQKGNKTFSRTWGHVYALPEVRK